MTYNHLTPTELVMIEAYFNQSQPVSKVANLLQRSRQTIYKVYRFLKSGGSAMSYYKQYKKTNVTAEDIRLFYLMSNRNTFKKVVQGWALMSLLVEQSFLLLVRYAHCIECLKIKPLTLTIYQ